MTESVAEDQIASFVDRILRLKEEERAIKADIREVYAEAVEAGVDKTLLGLKVRAAEQAERDLSVYFVAFRGAGLLKIGISGCVGQRMKTLSSIVGEPAELLLSFPGIFALEGWYHACFADHRRSGEWFNLNDETLARIEQVRTDGPAFVVRAA